jgi:high-affinity nickel-transport protein
MDTLPHDWATLLPLLFALGLRHGFDPDHLATIDGIARVNAAGRPRLAALSGLLFALGHGGVVIAVALGVASAVETWAPPAWLTHVGAWVSIACLIALGVLNLLGVLRAPAGRAVALSGLRSRWFRGAAGVSHPTGIVGVGALFALSIDTLAQAALFAVVASAIGGAPAAALMGIAFTLGMAATDGANGWWVARLARNAHRHGVVASRVVAAVVGVLSLTIAGLGIASYAGSGAASSLEEGTTLSLWLVGIVAAGFAIAVVLAPPPRTPDAARRTERTG